MNNEYIIFYILYIIVITLPLSYELNKRDSELRVSNDISRMEKLHRECWNIFLMWLFMLIVGYLIII